MTTSIQTRNQSLHLGGQGRVLAVVIALAIAGGAGFGLARGLSPAGPASLATVATDASYDAVERARAQTTLGAAPDTSYDVVEKTRTQVSPGAASDAARSHGRGLQPS